MHKWVEFQHCSLFLGENSQFVICPLTISSAYNWPPQQTRKHHFLKDNEANKWILTIVFYLAMREYIHTHRLIQVRVHAMKVKQHNPISDFFVCRVFVRVYVNGIIFLGPKWKKQHKIEEKHGKIWKTYLSPVFCSQILLFRKLIPNRLALHMQ